MPIEFAIYPDFGTLPTFDCEVESPIINISLARLELKSYGLTAAQLAPLSISSLSFRNLGALCEGIKLATSHFTSSKSVKNLLFKLSIPTTPELALYSIISG